MDYNGDSSATVFIDGETIYTTSRSGHVIATGSAGAEDDTAIQKAIDAMHPGGEIKILKGEYTFKKPVWVYNYCSIVGEGRSTIITPPENDYAFKILPNNRSIMRATMLRFDVPDYRISGTVIKSLAIDGKVAGKGIYLRNATDCLLEELWIVNTYSGAGLYLESSVMECDFVNIHLWCNGNEESLEGSLVICGQPEGDASNNIHFDRVYVICPNYRGLEIGANGEVAPRLIYFHHSMFHGRMHFEGENHASDELIYVRKVDGPRGMVVSDSRMTQTQDGYALVQVIEGSVTVSNCMIGGGTGTWAIRSKEAARLHVSGNTFHSGPDYNEYALLAEGSRVVFKNNYLVGKETKVCLRAAKGIIADNEFDLDTGSHAILVDDDEMPGASQVQIRGNIFAGKSAKLAIKVSEAAKDNVSIHGNQLIDD